jgi:hypothetical protein
MRTRIKVMDLTLRQWDHLQDNLRDGYEIPDEAVRVSVEFELDAQMNTRRVDMPVRSFVAMMTRLQRIERHGQIEEGAAQLPPPLPTPVSQPTCEHGSPVVDETPSAFEGGEPVRDYEDGCSSVGPYRPLSDSTFRLDT